MTMRLDQGPGPAERADLDRLELELRRLPDIIAVGFEGASADSPMREDEVIAVHVLVADAQRCAGVEKQAIDLGRLHLGHPLRVVVSPQNDEPAPGAPIAVPESVAALVPSRVRLVAIGLADEGRAVEVTLSHGQTRAVGLGPGGSPGGAVRAALTALRQLGWSVPFDLASAVRLAVGATGAVLVHLIGAEGERLGVSVGSSAEEAAVKATLQALNRWLDDPGRRPSVLRPVERD